MKSRARKAPVSKRVDTANVSTVLISAPVRLVTLEDPSASPTSARGAFARLRPPEGLPAAEVDAWRQAVAKVAMAVKVLPAPRAADVPADSHRVDLGEKIGTIREEALALATDSDNPAVVQLTTQLLDEVGA